MKKIQIYCREGVEGVRIVGMLGGWWVERERKEIQMLITRLKKTKMSFIIQFLHALVLCTFIYKHKNKK